MADNNKNNSNTIFRQKSLAKFSSVEDLDKYIKTTTPSLWLLLASIIVLLAGVIVWAVVGKINVESVSGCVIDKTNVTCFIEENRIDSINESSYIKINDKSIAINNIEGPYKADEGMNQSLLHTSQIDTGSWYYEVKGTCDLSDGDYKGVVIYKEVSPIVFVIN